MAECLVFGSRDRLSKNGQHFNTISSLEERGYSLIFSEVTIPQDAPSPELSPQALSSNNQSRVDTAFDAGLYQSNRIRIEIKRILALLHQWVRKTWHSRSASLPKRAMALATWLLVQLCYRSVYTFHHALWKLRSVYRRSVRKVYWTYWTIGFPELRRWSGAHHIRDSLGDGGGHVADRKTEGRPIAPDLCTNTDRRRADDGTEWESLHGAIGSLAACLRDLADQSDLPRVVFIPEADQNLFEELLLLVPELGLAQPFDITLVASLVAPNATQEAVSSTIAQRLASGSPFRQIVLATSDAAIAPDGVWHGLQVNRLAETTGEIDAIAGETPHSERLVTLIDGVCSGASEHHSISLRVDRFGPLAILASALWGRVGSSTIFEGQARVLLDEGYRVCRVYIDHWPHHGAARAKRIDELVAEDQETVRPHYQLVLERNKNPTSFRGLYRSPEFRAASPVLRAELILANTVTFQPRLKRWLKINADLAIVNHVSHLGAVEALTTAPVILETHDVYSNLLDIHGVPRFVPKGPDSTELRLREESAAWRRVAYCVNLSPNDNQEVACHTQRSAFVRPFKAQTSPSDRLWPEVCAANHFQGPAAEAGAFDLMLWGSWHKNNAKSIKWFFQKVRPKLASPEEVRIVVVGRVLNAIGRFVDKQPNVATCMFVDRLEDVASRARVLVIPDKDGTGTCVKAMDALSWGAAFSSTTNGLRGVEWDHSSLAPTDSAGDMAADIDLLLSSGLARQARKAIARDLYTRNFSLKAYETAWRRVLTQADQAVQDRATSIRNRQYPPAHG